jgi:hypothetical protein
VRCRPAACGRRDHDLCRRRRRRRRVM